MPRKSRQHILPKVFLNSFCDDSRPEDHPPDTPFKPGVWLIEKDFAGTPYRKSPENIFVERDTYTLRTDDPDAPIVEEWLNQLETRYARVLRKLLRGADVTPDEWGDLFLFVGALHARTLSQVALWQRQYGELESMTRMVERAHTDREDYSDSQFTGWEEIGKRSIRSRAESFAEVMTHGAMYLIENRTAIPFIASDTPTVLTHVFPATLQQWNFPEALLRDDVDAERRGFTCYCPLTPTHGVLASHLLGVPGEFHRLTSDDALFVASLVWLTVASADSLLIAHRANPLPVGLAHRLAQYQQTVHTSTEFTTFVRLIGPGASFTIEAADVRHELEGPFGVLRFRTSDLAQLHAAASVGKFVECEFQIGAEGSGGMRNVRFSEIAGSATEDSVLRQR